MNAYASTAQVKHPAIVNIAYWIHYNWLGSIAIISPIGLSILGIFFKDIQNPLVSYSLLGLFSLLSIYTGYRLWDMQPKLDALKAENQTLTHLIQNYGDDYFELDRPPKSKAKNE